MLLAAGVPPTQKTSRGRTAIDFAAKSKAAQRRKAAVDTKESHMNQGHWHLGLP